MLSHNLILYQRSKLMKCKMSSMIKMQRRRKSKEFGTKPKRTLSGKKIKKIKCLSKKKVKRLISNGKRNPNYQFLKLVKFKMKEKPILLNKAGFKEENSDTAGGKQKKEELQEVISNLKTTKQRLSKRDLKPNLSKKLQKERNLEEQVKERENQKEDDIF